jgi:hypothetical protein
MTSEEWWGTILWLIILWPIWSPRLNLIRYRRWRVQEHPGARASTKRTSTGTVIQLDEARRRARQTGPKWEQDKPFPECFDEGDDL